MEDIERKRRMRLKALDEIVDFIEQVNYGEVVITIHNSKVVQIEKREKKEVPAIRALVHW